MQTLVMGIVAHVDAGKTTLSESILYQSGKIKKLGRVDNQDAYLDNEELERARGITIFSKQALLEIGKLQVTLLDTPGHVDFSAEMERTLQVLDYAILVVSGKDGVQGHTRTLWRLLEQYHIPVFLFINKMDQDGTDKEKLMEELKQQLESSCVEFSSQKEDYFYDQLAMCDEELLETYLEKGQLETRQIKKAIKNRRVFPCYFGSALKVQGIEELLLGISEYAQVPSYPSEFGARIFKITRDEQGNRLTHLKVTGGKLKIRDSLTNGIWEEKINQIRSYSGEKFQAVNEIEAGNVCTVTGLTQTRAGEGIGIEKETGAPFLEPVLSYRILLPEGCSPREILPKLYQMEEEIPELYIVWEEGLQEIQARIMGEVQVEILQSLIERRFGIQVTFGEGRVIYKETITEPVEGVGHFEPLRHYAEVHLLLEPGVPGSGLKFEAKCSEDVLAKNWQRLILTHLEEKQHKGVLTGSPVTDVRITLVSGRAHNKHTEGGDFREATYRAVRQGLKETASILLEPYYNFWLELPREMVGKAMADIEKMHGTSELSKSDQQSALLTGSAPVITMRNYQKEVTAYTRGLGRLFCSLKGYGPCHNQKEVIEQTGYDSERDPDNPAGSVFCSHGTGFLVEWNQVKDYMHVESYFQKREEDREEKMPSRRKETEEGWISQEEIEKIINSTSYANQGRKSIWKKSRTVRERHYDPVFYDNRKKETREEYLLVDGYNIIYAWEELKELAEKTMDGARIRLMDALSNYQAIRKCKVIAVFDAYRIQGHKEEIIPYHNIYAVYTKEAQTADQYIEKFAHENQKKYRITVATSDGLEQMIIRGSGSALLSARELKEEMERVNEKLKQDYEETNEKVRNPLMDSLSSEVKQQIKEQAKE